MSNGMVREVVRNAMDSGVAKAHVATGASGTVGIMTLMADFFNTYASVFATLFGFISMMYAVWHYKRSDRRGEERLKLERDKVELRMSVMRDNVIREILDRADTHERGLIEKVLMRLKP